jgi:hypothetical protein
MDKGEIRAASEWENYPTTAKSRKITLFAF